MNRRLPARLDPYYKRLIGFRQRVWDINPAGTQNIFHAGVIHTIRFFYILLKEIQGHLLWQRAASLTYTTILSLFPLLIILTSLGSVFYNEQEEERMIDFIESRLLPPTDMDILNLAERRAVSDRQEQIQTFVQSIRQMSQSYRESAPGVGVFGLVAFLLAAFLLYNSIEAAFESAWETGRKRTLARTVSGFTILIVFAPLVFGVSITASSFLVKILGQEEVEAVTAEDVAAQAARDSSRKADEKEQEKQWEEFQEESEKRARELDEEQMRLELEKARMESGEQLPALTPTPAPSPTPVPTPVSPKPDASTATDESEESDDIITAVRNFDVLKVMLGLVTPLFNSIMLSLAFMLIPQRKVRIQYALIGGFTAGILWELAKVGFFYYVYLSTMRRQLLQSLGAVPIFLIWIYFTWMVFLLGNELTFVTQNFRKLIHLYFGRRNSTLFDGQIFVAATMIVADAFDRGEGGIRRQDLSQKLQLTFREFDLILQGLMDAGFLEVTHDNRVSLAKPASKIPVYDVLELGCDPSELCEYYELTKRPEVEKGLKILNSRILAVGKTVTIEDLLERNQELEPQPAG